MKKLKNTKNKLKTAFIDACSSVAGELMREIDNECIVFYFSSTAQQRLFQWNIHIEEPTKML